MAHQPVPKDGDASGGTKASELTQGTSLPSTDVFAILRNDRRRAAIQYLAHNRQAPSVAVLAKAIAAVEHDTVPAHVTDRQRKCAYVSLLQIHLPKLADLGVLNWGGPEAPITAIDPVIDELATIVALVEATCRDDG